jgi:hypothetical protein
MIDTPVFLFKKEGLTLSIYRSLSMLIRAIETYDVEDDLYIGWDIRGNLIEFDVDSSLPVSRVIYKETTKNDKRRLIEEIKKSIEYKKGVMQYFSEKRRWPVIHRNREKKLKSIQLYIDLEEMLLEHLEGRNKTSVEELDFSKFESAFDT